MKLTKVTCDECQQPIEGGYFQVRRLDTRARDSASVLMPNRVTVVDLHLHCVAEFSAKTGRP